MSKMEGEHKTIFRGGIGSLNAVLLFLSLTTALDVKLGVIVYLAVSSLAFCIVAILISLIGKAIRLSKTALGMGFIILLSDFILFALDIVPKFLISIQLVLLLLLGVLVVIFLIYSEKK